MTWGIRPWNATRDAHLVTEWDLAGAVSDPVVRCGGEFELDQTPCNRVPDVERHSHGTLHTVYLRSDDPRTHGWDLVYEAAQSSSVSRLCKLRHTDGAARGCTLARDPVCATSGSASLGLTDAGEVTGVVTDVAFPDGLRVDAEF